MSERLVIGLCTFRTMTGALGGQVYVKGKLPRRRGARPRLRQAEAASRPPLAGPHEGSGPPDGGSANTPTARSSDRTASGGPADGLGDAPKRAPTPGGEGPGSGDAGPKKPRKAPQSLKEMPGTPWALTKVVNEEEQIVPVIGELLRSNDEKVRLRVVELLIDAAYAENSGREAPEGGAKIQWNLPRPQRD